MKKTLLAALASVLLVGVAIVLPLSSAHALEVFSAETELRAYNSTAAFNGYILFNPTSNATTYSSAPTQTAYLMDMTGHQIKNWTKMSYNPRLLENGDLWSQGQVMGWDGTVKWQYAAPTGVTPHHDGQRIWNNKLNAYTYLMIASKSYTKTQLVSVGCDPNRPSAAVTGLDGVIEVNQSKQLIWQWWSMDHVCQSKNSTWPNYISDVKNAPGKCNLFWKTDQSQPAGTEGVVNDWHHFNALDYNEDKDHIVVNAKHWSEFYVVDHGKTFVSFTGVASTDLPLNTAAAAGSAGNFIYRFGNPSAYNVGSAPSFMNDGNQQIFGAHCVRWIRPYHWNKPHTGDTWSQPSAASPSVALPGAGNFIIFDNGVYRARDRRSRIHEINPYLNASGSVTANYVAQESAGWNSGTNYTKSKQITWTYGSNLQNSFYSSHISGVERLPNGNTAILAGNQGHMFQVTTGTAPVVVWEYLSPLKSYTATAIHYDSDSTNFAPFRFQHYSTNYPGFTGRTLTPGATFTGNPVRTVGSGGASCGGCTSCCP